MCVLWDPSWLRYLHYRTSHQSACAWTCPAPKEESSLLAETFGGPKICQKVKCCQRWLCWLHHSPRAGGHHHIFLMVVIEKRGFAAMLLSLFSSSWLVVYRRRQTLLRAIWHRNSSSSVVVVRPRRSRRRGPTRP
jgi:hypothetical protein